MRGRSDGSENKDKNKNGIAIKNEIRVKIRIKIDAALWGERREWRLGGGSNW